MRHGLWQGLSAFERGMVVGVFHTQQFPVWIKNGPPPNGHQPTWHSCVKHDDDSHMTHEETILYFSRQNIESSFFVLQNASPWISMASMLSVWSLCECTLSVCIKHQEHLFIPWHRMTRSIQVKAMIPWRGRRQFKAGFLSLETIEAWIVSVCHLEGKWAKIFKCL